MGQLTGTAAGAPDFLTSEWLGWEGALRATALAGALWLWLAAPWLRTALLMGRDAALVRPVLASVCAGITLLYMLTPRETKDGVRKKYSQLVSRVRRSSKVLAAIIPHATFLIAAIAVVAAFPTTIISRLSETYVAASLQRALPAWLTAQAALHAGSFRVRGRGDGGGGDEGDSHWERRLVRWCGYWACYPILSGLELAERASGVGKWAAAGRVLLTAWFLMPALEGSSILCLGIFAPAARSREMAIVRAIAREGGRLLGLLDAVLSQSIGSQISPVVSAFLKAFPLLFAPAGVKEVACRVVSEVAPAVQCALAASMNRGGQRRKEAERLCKLRAVNVALIMPLPKPSGVPFYGFVKLAVCALVASDGARGFDALAQRGRSLGILQ